MARAQARRQQRERITGIALAALGAAVLVVAVFALREPNGHVGSAPPTRTSGAAQNSTPSNGSARPSTAHSGAPSGSGPRSGSAGGGTPAGSDAVRSVPLVVYNDTTTQGLAHDAAQRFENGGWTVSRFENLPAGISDIISTCAYYDPSDPSAKPAAKALQKQYPTIRRTKPKFPGLGDGPVVVVLTPDYTSA